MASCFYIQKEGGSPSETALITFTLSPFYLRHPDPGCALIIQHKTGSDPSPQPSAG